MKTNDDEAQDTQEENQQRRTRGGAADVDRSKDFGDEQSGGPFGTPEKDAAEPEEKA
ncbi:MAG: hypothetical protein WBP93_00695 [Pyrinomonadaceae bacterium]